MPDTRGTFLDVHEEGLRHAGEELRGDKVQTFVAPGRAIIVLSDGLGSGVKANILATMTTSIIVKMLREGIELRDVMSTVIGTLPICRVRKVAYATFTIIDVDRTTDEFRITNFDNPPAFYFRRGKSTELDWHSEEILGRAIRIAEGKLAIGDFLGAISDGVTYAGLGTQLNFGWGWPNIVKHIEGLYITQSGSAHNIVHNVIAKTNSLYGGSAGDDATFVGINVRGRNDLIVFTGPPVDRENDSAYVEKVLGFPGRKVVCGGTTGTIVANHLGKIIDPDLSTLDDEIPPIGKLPEIDLLTEGIVTMAKTLEYVQNTTGDASRLPRGNTGAVLLSRELLRADSIQFLVGQTINEFYQNPLLPRNISIRRNLVETLARALERVGKEVSLEYC